MVHPTNPSRSIETTLTPQSLLPSLREISYQIINSRTVQLSAIIALMETLHRTTSDPSINRLVLERDFLKSTAQVLNPESILARSLSTATIISWMFHHMPTPLVCRQELLTSALFMDLGLLAYSQNSERRRFPHSQSANSPPAFGNAPRELNSDDVYERHPEFSAALISSVAGMPSSVRRIIRHHHASLIGMGIPGRTTSRDLLMPERWLSTVVRALELLENVVSGNTPLGQVNEPIASDLFAAIAAPLVNETIIGKWDPAFVDLVLSALSQALHFTASQTESPYSTFANKHRIDAASQRINRPHIQITNFVGQSVKTQSETPLRIQHPPMPEFAGPHYLLSEQRKLFHRQSTVRNEKDK